MVPLATPLKIKFILIITLFKLYNLDNLMPQSEGNKKKKKNMKKKKHIEEENPDFETNCTKEVNIILK